MTAPRQSGLTVPFDLPIASGSVWAQRRQTCGWYRPAESSCARVGDRRRSGRGAEIHSRSFRNVDLNIAKVDRRACMFTLEADEALGSQTGDWFV